jgi:predicted aspartyl protease
VIGATSPICHCGWPENENGERIEVTAVSSFDMFSRRRFLACTTATFGVAPFAAQADPEPGSSDVTGERDAGNRLTIPVQIAGKGPFQFVVDTGADRTVIADDVAAMLGLTRGERVSVQGIARSVEAETVRLDDLKFGAVAVSALETPVLPHAWLEADGYLGLNALDKRRVVFDFRHQRLTITAPHHFQNLDVIRPDETVVPVQGNSGRLRAFNCRVDGIYASAFIDSGAEISIGNTVLFNALLERSQSYDRPETVQLRGVTGGSLTGRVTKVERVQLGGFSFRDDSFAIADLQVFDLWNLADRPALFVGMDVLRQFAQVVIDYGLKEYRFEFASLA